MGIPFGGIDIYNITYVQRDEIKGKQFVNSETRYWFWGEPMPYTTATVNV